MRAPAKSRGLKAQMDCGCLDKSRENRTGAVAGMAHLVRRNSLAKRASSLLRTLALGILMIVGFSGCVTQVVWKKGRWDEFHKPSRPSNLALYEVPAKHDFLVEYDDLGPRQDQPVRRSYYLYQNASATTKAKKPQFTSVNPGPKGVVVPLLQAADTTGSASVELPYYVVMEDNQTFTLYENGGTIVGQYKLPTYKTSRGIIKRVAVTPFAVALDSAILGLMAYGLAASNSYGTPLWPYR